MLDLSFPPSSEGNHDRNPNIIHDCVHDSIHDSIHDNDNVLLEHGGLPHVLLKHGGLPHVLPLAVHLDFFVCVEQVEGVILGHFYS